MSKKLVLKQVTKPAVQSNIICADSLVWLADRPLKSMDSIVTVIPDMNEIGMTVLDDYVDFINRTMKLILTRIKDNHYAIFIQTDRKCNGEWIDKSYYLTDAAIHNGYKLVWHKIVCLREPGRINLHRPTYSHMLCYTREGKVGQAMTDVIDDINPVGQKAYENATPLNGAIAAIEYLVQQYNSSTMKQIGPLNTVTITDPFVGRGTILLVAKKAGFSVLG